MKIDFSKPFGTLGGPPRWVDCPECRKWVDVEYRWRPGDPRVARHDYPHKSPAGLKQFCPGEGAKLSELPEPTRREPAW